MALRRKRYYKECFIFFFFCFGWLLGWFLFVVCCCWWWFDFVLCFHCLLLFCLFFFFKTAFQVVKKWWNSWTLKHHMLSGLWTTQRCSTCCSSTTAWWLLGGPGWPPLMKDMRKYPRPSCSADPVADPYHTTRKTTPTFQDSSFLISPFSIRKSHLLWFSLLSVVINAPDHDMLEEVSSILLTMLTSRNGALCICVILYLKYLLRYGYSILPRFSVVKL